jgi:hypothetical protein
LFPKKDWTCISIIGCVGENNNNQITKRREKKFEISIQTCFNHTLPNKMTYCKNMNKKTHSHLGKSYHRWPSFVKLFLHAKFKEEYKVGAWKLINSPFTNLM